MNRGSPYLHFDDLVLDLEYHRLWRGARQIDLPGLSFRLLEVLKRHAPRVVSRRQLRRAVWGDVVVSDDALRH